MRKYWKRNYTIVVIMAVVVHCTVNVISRYFDTFVMHPAKLESQNRRM